MIRISAETLLRSDPRIDAADLSIIAGRIPPELNGAYMRNGPNPLYKPISYSYPMDGDGMIHAVYLDNGRARYRNRFVNTHALTAERRAGRAIYGGFPASHAGRSGRLSGRSATLARLRTVPSSMSFSTAAICSPSMRRRQATKSPPSSRQSVNGRPEPTSRSGSAHTIAATRRPARCSRSLTRTGSRHFKSIRSPRQEILPTALRCRSPRRP